MQSLGVLRGHSNVADVRIRGSIAAVELTGSAGYLAEIGPRLHRFCLERGVFLRPLGNVLYAMPPLGTSDASLRQVADVMVEAVEIGS